mgnify:FL=1
MTTTQKRAEWLIAHRAEIEAARTSGHGQCRGKCKNGATCCNQSSGGYGWIARALASAGIEAEATTYWSGSLPTPSTSINRGIAQYIDATAPQGLTR